MYIESLGLSRFEKAAILNSSENTNRVHLPSDYLDDLPMFRVTLEDRLERHTGLLGVLAFDVLHHGSDLRSQLGMIGLELSLGTVRDGTATLRTDEPLDRQVLHAIHWSGMNLPAVSADVFAQETHKRNLDEVFEVITKGQFAGYLPTLGELASELQATGIVPALSSE